MRWLLSLSILLTFGLANTPPAAAQSDPCEREAVIQSFARAVTEDTLEAWHGSYATGDCPSQIKIGARMLLAAYMTMNVSVIPFEVPPGSGQLNPIFGWQPGQSDDNAYTLLIEPGALAMISGWGNAQWDNEDSAPLITYAITGDFETQIRLDVSEASGNHVAALGVRSASDNLTWIRVARRNDTRPKDIALQTNSEKQGVTITTVPFAEAMVYFKIIRQGSTFSFFYSTDGGSWQALKEGFAFPMPDDVEIFFTYYLTPPPPVGDLRALFSDFSVVPH